MTIKRLNPQTIQPVVTPLPILDPAWASYRFSMVGTIRGGELMVFIHEAVIEQAKAHARERVDEVFGIGLGAFGRDPQLDSEYVVIEAYVPARKAKSARAHVVVDHEAWMDVYAAWQATHPDKLKVAWCHTHPGYTVFLSEDDRFVQSTYSYPEHRYMVAWVLDPLSEREGAEMDNGVFVWTNGRISQRTGYWIIPRDHKNDH